MSWLAIPCSPLDMALHGFAVLLVSCRRCLLLVFLLPLLLTVGNDARALKPPGTASMAVISGGASDYRLAVGDRLSLFVAGVPEYTGVLVVLPNGAVRLLDYGDVPVVGLTLEEAQQRILQAYVRAQLLTEPAITLGLTETSPRRVTVIGRVARPGTFLIPATAIAKLPRLTELLQQAGGVLDSADVRRVELQRVSPAGARAAAETLDLSRLLLAGDLGQNPVIQDGDVIVVPELSQADTTYMNQVAAANFASGEILVGLVGSVPKPGVVKLPPGTSLNEALLQAGGFSPRADATVTLVRYGPTGNVEQSRVAIDWGAAPGSAANPALRSRDFVVVGRNFGAQISDALGEILAPLNGAVGLFNLYTLFAVPR